MLPFLLLLSLILPLLAAEAPTSSLALPGCQEKCGNVDIPYPFGTGNSSCYRDTGFWITCNDSFTPHKPFIRDGDIEVLELSTAGYLRTDGWMSWQCYSNGLVQGGRTGSTDISAPYIFSDTRNKFTVIGCDTVALIMGSEGRSYTGGCIMLCQGLTSVINGSCDGIGCCQQSIPKGLRKFEFTINSFNNHSGVSDFNPCSYAFLVDVERFNFSTEYLRRRNFSDRRTFPRVLDWAIRDQGGCKEAERNGTYACGKNTDCLDSDNGPGYLCNCSLGYRGNPYLKDGCRDVNECEGSSNPCKFSRFCNNTEGSFGCSCPSGYYGDGLKNGNGCTRSPSKANYAVIKVTIGITSGFLFLLIGGSWLFWLHKKNKLAKLREKFFHQNGGFLLQQQMSSHGAAVETTKLFTAEELKRATNNFSATQILGKGGYGTVYRGVLLPDNRIVAIKRSQMVDETQIEQFINELLILSQIHHRNVVKLLGCCLETEVPLLVYEFVSNGTLFEHIHDERHVSSLSWENRLRIATETARALSYLHSAASLPIIHRDIKSSNILLDDNYTAKVADFGASRLIPLDQSQLNTLVQGTLGYLDPEYFLTSQLTDKSDVYSFGVVLVELLTGKLPLSFERSEEDRNLAMYFISSMKQKRVLEILEERVVDEASREQLLGVADLAKRCLRVRGEERPSMKEVEMEMEGLRKLDNHPWRPENPEETEFLLGKPSKTLTDQASATSSAVIDYDSLKDQIKFSLAIGR